MVLESHLKRSARSRRSTRYLSLNNNCCGWRRQVCGALISHRGFSAAQQAYWEQTPAEVVSAVDNIGTGAAADADTPSKSHAQQA